MQLSQIIQSALLCSALVFTLEAAPASLDSLRMDVNNHEAELRMLLERLNTQEILISSLQDEIRKAGAAAKGNNQIADLETKLDSYRELLQKIQHKLDTFEASLDQQTKNSRHLEKSLGTLLDAVGESAPATGDSPGIYRVASGDTLEKIAKKQKTTIRAIKELNGLENDRIFIGQKLKIPE